MKVELCDEFFYRITNPDVDLCKEFNTSKEKILRNNENIKLYVGEIVKIKVNDFQTHYVKPAETLQQIAENHKTNVEKLKHDNNLESDKLFIGQRLKIYKICDFENKKSTK